jgi:hypothetical protein
VTDINWKSFVGPDDNGRTITERNWMNPPDGGFGYSDIFKCSHVEDLTAVGITIDASKCREDAIDCVRGKNYRWLGCHAIGSITIKGAIDGWHYEGGTVHRVIELGQFDNYWKPGNPPTRNGRLTNTTKPDGSPIHLVLWDAEMPIVVNTNVRVWRVPKIVWFPYFCFRWASIRLFPTAPPPLSSRAGCAVPS